MLAKLFRIPIALAVCLTCYTSVANSQENNSLGQNCFSPSLSNTNVNPESSYCLADATSVQKKNDPDEEAKARRVSNEEAAKAVADYIDQQTIEAVELQKEREGIAEERKRIAEERKRIDEEFDKKYKNMEFTPIDTSEFDLP